MTTLTLECSMPDPEATNTGTWGAVAGGIVAGLGLLYTFWDKIKGVGASNTATSVESDALVATKAAVDSWKLLYETAQAGMNSERTMREAAEARLTSTLQEMEGLRSEVASLRRDIEQLTATVDAYRKGAT